jgi:hypothetical protein
MFCGSEPETEDTAFFLKPTFRFDISNLLVNTSGHDGRQNHRFRLEGGKDVISADSHLRIGAFFYRRSRCFVARSEFLDSEWRTRKRLIDPKLWAAGWRVVKYDWAY